MAGKTETLARSVSVGHKQYNQVIQYTSRVAVIGTAGAGKTSILTTFAEHENVLSHKTPVRGFTNAIYNDSERIVALDILEHSSSCKRSAFDYPGIATCDVFILIFVLGDMESFEEVVKLRQQLMDKRRHGRQPVVAIVGNKSDLYDRNNTTSNNVMTELTVTCDWGHLYFETSISEEETIHDCFRQVIKTHLKESGQLIKLESPMQENRRASCPPSLLNVKRRLSKLIQKTSIITK